MRTTDRRHAIKGLSLIELLIGLLMMTVLAVALSYAFIAGVDMQRQHDKDKVGGDKTAAMEKRLTTLLKGTILTPALTDMTSYFEASSTYGANVTDLGSDTLTFTTSGLGVPMVSQTSQDDFETQTQEYGPIGGIDEVSWTVTSQGDPGNHTGLFERIQRPSDGDPTQGGYETLLTDTVERIGFQFWNGTTWVTSWDTIGGQRRLPAAVMVSYVLKGDPSSTVKQLWISIPESDVTATNPSTNGQ